ncbi:BBE domain-containing protein [Streptomyces sp. NPDC001231]|uniref:BBE domain-containing protein n=1 Tax=Streptomyces sp. NPDC001231 TaxID=3364549 RepID=UPI00369BB353
MDGAYVNVPNVAMQDRKTAYWGSDFGRLRKIKAKYHPHNVFQYDRSIPPESR